ncbi:hypothetical protein [Haloplanus salilacus]|uniref:hypothetical protein n=1 Tax=Haloplanus salilacus TaxID=2949994 RepID=UPI0030CEFC85
MQFDIGDKIRDGLGRSKESNDSGTSFTDVDRPEDVTVERVRSDLTDAIASGDLAVEDTEFKDESALLGAVEPIIRDYCEYHNLIASANEIQTAMGTDTDDTDSATINELETDEAVRAINRHTPKVVSVLEGFGETEPFAWTTSYVNQYPYFGCLVEYVFAYSELEDQE